MLDNIMKWIVIKLLSYCQQTAHKCITPPSYLNQPATELEMPTILYPPPPPPTQDLATGPLLPRTSHYQHLGYFII